MGWGISAGAPGVLQQIEVPSPDRGYYPSGATVMVGVSGILILSCAGIALRLVFGW
jgi:hypothetical protein